MNCVLRNYNFWSFLYAEIVPSPIDLLQMNHLYSKFDSFDLLKRFFFSYAQYYFLLQSSTVLDSCKLLFILFELMAAVGLKLFK